MKKFLFLVLLCLPRNSFAEDYVCHKAGDTTKYERYIHSIDPSKVGTNCFQVSESNISSQMALINSVSSKYLKIKNNLASEITQEEKDTVDAAEQAALTDSVRAGGKNEIDQFDQNSIFIRASLEIIKDEINILRAAVVPALPARTTSQLKTAIKNKIDSGSVDT